MFVENIYKFSEYPDPTMLIPDSTVTVGEFSEFLATQEMSLLQLIDTKIDNFALLLTISLMYGDVEDYIKRESKHTKEKNLKSILKNVKKLGNAMHRTVLGNDSFEIGNNIIRLKI